MKVLHLTTHVNVGGITTYIFRLIQPFQKLGVETFVVSSGGNCSGELVQAGAKTFELPLRTKNELSPKIYFNLPAVIRILKNNKIDLIHAHTRVTQVMAFWLQKITGIPFVTTCHGYYKKRIGRRLLPAWGARAIAISQGVADHLSRDFGLLAGRIKQIPNGVNLAELAVSYRRHDAENTKLFYRFNSEDPVIGSVGRLVQDKGHEYLIRAAPLLIPEFPSLRLLIVGDGPFRNELEKQVRELKLEAHVVFTGSVKDVTQPLAATDIFVLPATWREGFGLSIVEAMACGKPVIVSNIWSLNTLIQDGVTGILTPPKAIEPLAEAIRRLLKNREEKNRISQAGQIMVGKLFSVSRMAEEIYDTYSEIIRSRSMC